MNLRTKVTVVIATAALAAAAVFPAASGAAPIDDKRRQAAELQRQIEANDNDLVATSEQLNGARLRMTQAQEAIAEAEARTKAAEAERRSIRAQLGQRAAQIYRSAGTSTPLAQIDVSSVTEMTSRSKYASAAAERDDQLIAQLQKVEEDLAVRQADLQRQKAAAESEAKAAESARARIAAANRQAQALRNQVQGEIATILAEQAAAQAAASQRAAAQRAAAQTATRAAPAPSSRRTQAPVNFPDAPAPNGGAAAAVAFAKAQVGKSYRYATSGPDSFDCSGLTSAAWARGGVSLAHYSGAQYQQTIRIGANDLQPGDLVFYGPGGSNHVEIYIGGGMVVSAVEPVIRGEARRGAVRVRHRLRPGTRLSASPHPGDIRLTTFSHGAGCACKLSPEDLRTVLGLVRGLDRPPDPDLIVGLDTADDAAVYRVRDDLAIVLTTDFFTPIVDDAFDWGRIAATNALSDVYAMGAAPLLALNLVAWPRDGLPFELLARVLDGGAQVAADAGMLIAGGHSIDDPEPKYGLAVVGTVEPDRGLAQCGRRAGRRARAHQADRPRCDQHRRQTRRRDRRTARHRSRGHDRTQRRCPRCRASPRRRDPWGHRCDRLRSDGPPRRTRPRLRPRRDRRTRPRCPRSPGFGT